MDVVICACQAGLGVFRGSSASTWRDQAYWQGRFSTGDTPWELGVPSSVLQEALGELEGRGFSIRGCSALSPGCGTASDALELVRLGARVIGVDWSERALGEARRRYEMLQAEALTAASQSHVGLPVGGLLVSSESRGDLELHQGDFFSIQPKPVDLVCEHTFFCAIDPSMRPQYVQAIASWIKPRGFLVGNFFLLDNGEAAALPGLSLTKEGQGPPFACTRDALEQLLTPYFKVIAMHPAKHPDQNRRPGMEWVSIFQRND